MLILLFSESFNRAKISQFGETSNDKTGSIECFSLVLYLSALFLVFFDLYRFVDVLCSVCSNQVKHFVDCRKHKNKTQSIERFLCVLPSFDSFSCCGFFVYS